MIRERALRVVLVLLGLLFIAMLYPIMQPGTPIFAQMMGSLYVTLGVFLLLASRSPAAHRSLIAFAAWSSFAHGAVMAMQVYRQQIPRGDLLGAVLPLAVIGVVLLVLSPPKLLRLRASAVRPSPAEA